MMENRYTPETIRHLQPNEVFVFGSNLSGYHIGGAAKIALKEFGAIYGQSEGLQGQSYAIPTLLPEVDMIRPYVNKFNNFARKHPELIFLVTRLGCGNAGYTPYDIAPLFADSFGLNNVILPESFVYVIKTLPRYIGNPLNSWDKHKDFLDLRDSMTQSLIYRQTDIHDILIRTFHNTIQIVSTGFYITEEGRTVILPDDYRMINGTILYEKEFSVDNVPSLNQDTIVEVREKDCLKEAVRLTKEGLYPAVLNMANRLRPGGGVLNGSKAQEESIFRRTNIFRSLFQFSSLAEIFGCIKSEKQYPLDKNFGGVYSPHVLLFRESENNGCKLLENPRYINVISVAAMNRPRINPFGEIEGSLVDGIKNKIRTIFRIALRHRHDSLVLGAWGCGAFCNSPKHIAGLFHEIMNEKEFKNKFRKIVFAIIDDHNSRKAHNPEGNLKPFKQEFNIG